MAVTETPWTPASWHAHEALQQPAWPDAARAEEARAQLRGMPPLVFAGEARALQDALADVAAGRAFLLQAGDCAESFHDTSAVTIREKLKILLQMSVVLTYAAALPVVKVGRIAGQFAKPRSAPTERVGDVDLTSFFGHLVNDDAPTAEARVPDPQRMLRAYDQSARTLNLLRAFAKGGFADISRVHEWNQEFVASSAEGRRYEQVASEIERALRFMTACGIDIAREAQLHQVDVWTSHEGLVLDYEEGLTRKDSLTGDWYDCSAHMLWLGERTRQPDGAHAAFFAGVHNPLGIKLGPSATPAEVVEFCARLDPHRAPGRLTLITRMGASHVRDALPPLLRAVKEAGHPVVWSCDPMHANGIKTASGLKTRRFDAVMDELEGFVTTCRSEDTWPGGVHLEFTGEDVTECLGGAEAVLEDQLETRYMTLCDPRLNARQSLDLAFRLAELMRGDVATGVIQRLAIVGLGLMGGSLGLAARERAAVPVVVGCDPDEGAREAALQRGCVDEAVGDLATAVAGADLVVLCAPVAALPGVLSELAELAPGATVTDIGSTKAGVVAAVPDALRPRFIGGHPLCGMETRGAQNARAELFEGATWYLTPLAETEPARLRDLHRLVAALGATPVAVDAGVHDRLLALTSHLPHVLANLLVVQAGEARIDGHDPLTAIGGSFRDMTRVAGANPRIWVDIYLDNREALAAVLREHQRALAEALAALESGDAGYLARWIGQASGHRRRALAAQFDQRPEELYRVQVHVPDRPGVFAGITQALGAARINIEDFELHHFTPERGGTIELLVAGQDAAERAVELLDGQGYGALAAPVLAEAT